MNLTNWQEILESLKYEKDIEKVKVLIERVEAEAKYLNEEVRNKLINKFYELN